MTNPLSKHFRQPALYLSLASKGRFYTEGTVELSATGTVPIFPMTVKDELTLKTPDAVLSGQAVVDIIKSCCPAIKDPWEMPMVDLDPVLIAIRLASYGKGMDFTSRCPHCQSMNEYKIDLNMILDGIGKANYDKAYVFDNLTFKFKPQKYKHLNRVNTINFENEKLVQNVIQNETLSEEEKMTEFKKSFDRIRQLNLDVITDSIDSITTEDGNVITNREYICEFLSECSRLVYEDIKKSIQDIVETFKIQPVPLTCENEECGKEFKTVLSFDHSNFFV
jgi:hypothetical protein